jgi:hypothetical protein
MTPVRHAWRAFGAATAIAVLTACTGADLRTGPASRVGVSFVPDSGGLSVESTGQRIDFGRSPAGVIPVMDRELGRGRDLGLDGCPAGVVKQVSWGDLALSFTKERFVGWREGDARAGSACS